MPVVLFGTQIVLAQDSCSVKHDVSYTVYGLSSAGSMSKWGCDGETKIDTQGAMVNSGMLGVPRAEEAPSDKVGRRWQLRKPCSDGHCLGQQGLQAVPRVLRSFLEEILPLYRRMRGSGYVTLHSRQIHFADWNIRQRLSSWPSNCRSLDWRQPYRRKQYPEFS